MVLAKSEFYAYFFLYHSIEICHLFFPTFYHSIDVARGIGHEYKLSAVGDFVQAGYSALNAREVTHTMVIYITLVPISYRKSDAESEAHCKDECYCLHCNFVRQF